MVGNAYRRPGGTVNRSRRTRARPVYQSSGRALAVLAASLARIRSGVEPDPAGVAVGRRALEPSSLAGPSSRVEPCRRVGVEPIRLARAGPCRRRARSRGRCAVMVGPVGPSSRSGGPDMGPAPCRRGPVARAAVTIRAAVPTNQLAGLLASKVEHPFDPEKCTLAHPNKLGYPMLHPGRFHFAPANKYKGGRFQLEIAGPGNFEFETIDPMHGTSRRSDHTLT